MIADMACSRMTAIALLLLVSLTGGCSQGPQGPGGPGGSVGPPGPPGSYVAGPGILINGNTLSLDTGAFDVRDYGARCDGATDDSAAWQAAIDAAAAVPEGQYGGAPLAAKIIGCQHGPSLITKTLNFTGFTSFGEPTALALTVDMSGTCLIGETDGTPVIDALGSRFINWEHVCIWGSATKPPNIGMQIGNSNNTSADQHNFIRPVIYGNFTFTAFYNAGSETCTFIQPWFLNNYTVGKPFALVLDGYNHWNMKSAFINVTTPVDTPQSFNENAFYGGWIGSDFGTPIWVGNASRHRFIAGYSETTGTGLNNVTLWNEGGNTTTDLYLDVHFESTVVDTFLISGPDPSPVFSNFVYHDQESFASNSLFKLDTGVTSAAIYNGTVQVSWFGGGPNVQVFDSPSSWSFSGTAYVPGTSNWRAFPAKFSGNLCIADSCMAHPVSPTGVKFTASGCAVSSTNGGATAGTFMLGATGCNVVIAMAGSMGLRAPNSWSCQAHDATRPGVLIGGEFSSTATTASIAIPSTAGVGDVVSFSCQPY